MRREPEQSVLMNDLAWERKRPWHPIHSECYRYARPGMNPYFESQSYEPAQGMSHTRGELLGEDIVDSTLPRSLTRLANRIVLDMFPPGREWAEFGPGMKEGGGEGTSDDKANAQGTGKTVFGALHDSHVDPALHETVLDAASAGTGVMRIGASTDPNMPLSIAATSQVQVALEAGPAGTLWGFHRKMMLPRDHIRSMWPDADAPPEDSVSKQNVSKPRLHDICECTYFDVHTGWWYYDVILRSGEGGSQKPMRLFEERTPVSRWIAWRWARMADEVYGRSPVMDALPDARTANEIVATMLETASMRVAGIYTYINDSVLNPNTIRMQSGMFIPVGSNDQANPSVRPLELAGNPQDGWQQLEDLRESIRGAMLARSLPEPGSPVRSATEVQARLEETYQDVGAPFARVITELAIPLLQTATWVLQDAGLLDDAAFGEPTEGVETPMLRLDGSDLGVTITSPLAQSQKLSDVRNLVEACDMARMATGEAAFQSAYKTPKIAAKIGELMSIDAKLVSSEDEAQQQYEQMLAAQQPDPAEGPEGAAAPQGAANAAP